MNVKTTAPAPAQSAPSPKAESEPSTLDLAQLIGGAPAAPAKAPKKTTAPAAEDPDLDPELEDEPEDDTAPTAEQPDDAEAEEEQPTGEEEADEQPAEETEEEPADPEPEDLDEEDRATRKAFTPAQQKRFDKALFKQREKSRQQIEQLQQELAEAKAQPPAPLEPTPDNPLADIASDRDLAAREREQRELRRWALTHPQGGTIKGPKGDIEISAERAAEIIADTEEMLQVHIPARREFLRHNAQLEQQAVQDYPWLKAKNTQGAVAIDSMLREFGHMRLRDIPGIRGSLADLYIGQIIRAQNKRQAGTAPAAKKGAPAPKAPATPAGQRPPPKVAGAVKKTAGATKSLEDTGSDPDNAALGALISR